ncbi:hypothetical protein [Spirosoma endophyticum]|uniref:Uncharacterized protein n=1 Tax=Spirosoma endophyticum TaxID=662367 RepID=A0A1I1GXQ4_9BACT|nr:hypothetical protein [Spirosoma endophyticum]SFC16629.1 hypothetical protein SAMN05216167_101582 [Spirosoma endophyticum]
MEDFTPEQIIGITNSYTNMARALNKFQVMHWPELTLEQQLDLNAYQNSLLNRGQDIYTRTIRPAFKSASEMSAIIRHATDEATLSLQRMNDPVVALNIGAITVALASYVSRSNMRGIQTALRELGDLLKMEAE